MASPIHKVVHHLRRATLQQDAGGLSDGQLLGGFIERRDEAAAAALVRWHGPMVWGVCRRVLGNGHDAEDAFQATFLVLVRRAAAIAPRGMVGNWLYGVAHQTALKARAMRAKRPARERQVTAMAEPRMERHDPRDDLQAVLDQELSRLPDKYRAAIVLCDLEGKTRKEAAQHLGVPDGTLAARLARGRTMLGKRLARQGVAVPSGALAAMVLPDEATAGVPTSVVSATIKAVSLSAAGKATAAGVVSVRVAASTEGVLKTLLLTKLRSATAGLLVAGLLVTALLVPGLSGLRDSAPARQSSGTRHPQEKPVDSGAAKNARDAGQEEVRVGKPGAEGAPRAHEWSAGTWRSYKLDYGDFKRWKGKAQVERVATSPDEIGLFLISADGKRRRAGDSQPSLLDDRKLSFGPIGSSLSFYYRRSQRPGPRGLARDNALTLDLNEGGVAIHVELLQDRRFAEQESKQIRPGMTVAQVTALLGCPPGDYTGGKGLYVAFVDPFPVAAFRRQFAVYWCGHTGAIGLVLDTEGKVRYADWYPALDPEDVR
jgi:RNA polymerase sigma factor (sigma-70 family)